MVTIGTIGSHSAEEIAIAAKANGFKTVVFCQQGRDKYYRSYHKHLFDTILTLEKFSDILFPENQAKLHELETILIPNRSLTAYLSYDSIEKKLNIPIYGNRNLLRIEDRKSDHNQYWLMEQAHLRFPHRYSLDKIPELAIVKVQQKNNPLERAFFYASSVTELHEKADSLIKQNVISEKDFRSAIIEEFVIGPRFNANFQAYGLSGFDQFDFVGFDDRIQTNLGGILNLPAQDQLKLSLPLTNEEVGHRGVSMRESKKILVYEAAEAFLTAVQYHFPPKMIGLFALQGAINDKSEFVIFDISPRVPGAPILGPTSPEMRRLSLKYHTTIESPLDLCMMEIKKAESQHCLNEVTT